MRRQEKVEKVEVVLKDGEGNVVDKTEGNAIVGAIVGDEVLGEIEATGLMAGALNIPTLFGVRRDMMVRLTKAINEFDEGGYDIKLANIMELQETMDNIMEQLAKEEGIGSPDDELDNILGQMMSGQGNQEKQEEQIVELLKQLFDGAGQAEQPFGGSNPFKR